MGQCTTMETHRTVWPTQLGGFLVSVGFMTGLANMAFFPSAICAEGQTGNFIVVYLICIVVVGFPLTYLHLCLGQFSGCTPIDIFAKLCPMLRGIGWSWVLIIVPMLVVSNMNTAWSLYYMYATSSALLQDARQLPWQPIVEHGPVEAVQPSSERHSLANLFKQLGSNHSSAPFYPAMVTSTPDYFHHLYGTVAPRVVLRVDEHGPTIEKQLVMGSLEPRMLAALAVSWLLVLMCVCQNSLNTMNQLVYVTATLPLLILLVLAVRCLHLMGAWEGLALLQPRVTRIMDKSIWVNALKLIFFDLQIGVGVLMSVSRHNRFHTNIFRDAVALVAILVSAVVAFSLLGYLAYNLHEADVRSMCRGQVAPHLLWDQIMRALAYLPSHEAKIFSFLYQLMLALGALDCSFTWCECISAALDDRCSLLMRRPRLLRALICFFFFVISIPCCFQSGVHVYDLLVFYSLQWNVMFIAVIQLCIVSVVYGVNNLCRDISKMLRICEGLGNSLVVRVFGPTGWYVRHSWNWTATLLIAVITLCDMVTKESEHSFTPKRRPGDVFWLNFASLLPLLPIPIIAIWEACCRKHGRDMGMMTALKWRQMQPPIDESTMDTDNNRLMLNKQLHETELDNEIDDEDIDSIPVLEAIEPASTNSMKTYCYISRAPYLELRALVDATSTESSSVVGDGVDRWQRHSWGAPDRTLQPACSPPDLHQPLSRQQSMLIHSTSTESSHSD